MASIVKRGKSYGVIYYIYVDGVRKQKWETYHSEAEALRRKEVVESWLRVRQRKTTGKIETVEQLVWAYVRLYGKSRWSLSMYDSSLGLINNYIIPYFGSIRLHELSPRMVAWMYGDLLGQQRYNDKFHKHPGERLSPHTLKSVHKLLHSVFEQAVLWEYVPSNPFQRAILPKVRTTRVAGGLHKPYKGIMLAAPKGAPKRSADRILLRAAPPSGAVLICSC